ncbi:MAG: nucleotide exchange factor GrpE [Alphaproteobacteria bacterium]|nr:nucleotide exchange factor GrpE [Alphaproteobacteria bacterium]
MKEANMELVEENEAIEGAEKEAAATENAIETPDPVAELTAQNASLKDQLLRAMAEAENVRRRGQKEREDTAKYATSNFAREMLTVADNFRRALDAVPKDADGNNETLKHLMAGVEATERQLLSSLEKFGIKQMSPMGQPFDPHYHRVMVEIEDAAHPAGTVVQIIQAGYMIHDRLLREALVAVSKGGPKIHKIDTSA